MLTLFFTIIFIAEVIIAFQLILLIQKVDHKVSEYNAKVLSLTTQIEVNISKLRKNVEVALNGVLKLEQIIQKQKKKYKYTILKNIFTTLIFLVLNKNGRQILTAIDLVFTAKEFFDRAKSRKSSL